MATNKTTPQAVSAEVFLHAVVNDQRRADGLALCELMRAATGADPVMWGPSIVGFGTHRYEYESGRTGETAAVGFSPRSQALVCYGLDISDEATVASLGKVTTGKGCLYIPRLAAIDQPLLSSLIQHAFTTRAT